MMKKLFCTLIIIATIVFGCRTKTNEVDFEKKVLYEIIPSLVDSVCMDPRIFLSPPPYSAFPPNEAKLSDEEKNRLTKQWELKIAAIKRDTTSVYLAFNPVIKNSEDLLAPKLAKYTSSKILPSKPKENLTLAINSIQLHKPYQFKSHTYFSNKIAVWQKKYDFIFSGFFYVSRIVFDENKRFGALSVGYTCGDLCGQGYVFYIKRQGKKWKIVKIEDTWIS